MKARLQAGRPHDHTRQIARSQNQACINCIFWYQCRDGRIDCDMKSQ